DFAACAGCDLRADGWGLAGGGGGSDQAGEYRDVAVCGVAVHGRGGVYGAVDVSYAAEGHQLCLRGFDGEEAPDCVGAAGGGAVGGGEYSDGVCDTGCGAGGGVSDVE